MPLLYRWYTLIHWAPLLASLLATMLRTQSSTVWGDSRCHRLLLWLAIVVSVITCERRISAAAACLPLHPPPHHARARLVKVVEGKGDGGVGGEGHVQRGNGLRGVAAAAPDAVRQAVVLVDSQHAYSA